MSTAAATAARTWSSSVTSQATAMALPPASSMRVHRLAAVDDIGDHDVRALGCEPFRRHPTQPGRRARDERDLPLEPS